jgi:hypothetical protein
MQQFQVLLKVVRAFQKKWSTQEVFIKPAIHLEECHSIAFYAVFVYVQPIYTFSCVHIYLLMQLYVIGITLIL